MYVLPVLLSGAETRSLTSVLENKLNACQQWCLRRLLHISHLQRVTNTEVLRRSETRLSTVLCNRRLQLYDMLSGQMRGWTIREHCAQLGLPSHWRRPTGQSRQSWRQTIEKDPSALGIGLHTAWRRAQDCEQWQRTVEAAMLQHGACS